MEGGPADSPVTLVIKAPNQKYEDQTITCFLNWTVERLKSHISNVYPSKPRTRDQWLVYSGRLLQDHLSLREVLRKQDQFHMMHLVCSSPTSSETHNSSNNSDSSSSESVPSVSAPQENQASTSSSLPTSYDGLRYRGAAPQYDPQNLAAAPQWPNGGPGVPLYMPVQLLWWQQVYAQQYYLQYQAAVAASQTPPAEPPPTSPHQPPPPPANEAVQQPLAPNPAPDPLPENPPANQNIQMNAQGGAVLNEDELNRDWLDWLYTVSRASMLLSIVYFYSSFSRFIMVVGAMLLVYLHQVGWFPFRPEQQNLGGGDAGAGAPREAEHQQDLQEMERLMDDGVEDDNSSEEGGTAANVPPQTGYATAVWSFISTFFTSLIPEGRPQAAN